MLVEENPTTLWVELQMCAGEREKGIPLLYSPTCPHTVHTPPVLKEVGIQLLASPNNTTHLTEPQDFRQHLLSLQRARAGVT